MEEQQRGLALVILGIVAVIAVVGLVLMFSGAKKSAGAIFTSATGGEYVCPIPTQVGEPQWFPVLAGPWETNFEDQWEKAGYECIPPTNVKSIDEYGYKIKKCCRNPANVPVNMRGPVPLETRQGSGIPVGSQYMGNYQYAAPADWQQAPRTGP